ncbi:MAG: Rpn family recombination-promoting nuclease/putative transposase [Spirochaetaceae bacterium]|jgi:predicted transposase/invertase (TIGR01784 family)|nr:Rpn family recombination-promoting nuclease/putative transposase [Spirochaetaceae bacterium]
MGANIKYKDSVFSFLFSDPDLLRELYGALEGVSLPSDIPVTINTLQDVLFKDRINDISFEIGDKLVILIEHQSTINPNIALRLLIYIARIYEKIVGEKNIYASRLIHIPRPEFFVLYNGVSPYPDEKRIKLSDAFASELLPEIGKNISLALELEVRVININQGRNKEIAERCKTLWEYSAFIEKVREIEKETENLEGAVRKAVIYCRDHDILKEFLEKNATEVLNMLMTEWNWDDALTYRYEEGIEEGMEKGREEGRTEVARNLLSVGSSYEFVSKITGLDIQTITSLSSNTIREPLKTGCF